MDRKVFSILAILLISVTLYLPDFISQIIDKIVLVLSSWIEIIQNTFKFILQILNAVKVIQT
jgi:hypothetical protein